MKQTVYPRNTTGSPPKRRFLRFLGENPRNTSFVFAAALILVGVILSFALSASLFHVPNLPTALGDFFTGAYGILAFLIPLYIFFAAILLLDPTYRPGRIFAMDASIFPFITLAIGFSLLRDFEHYAQAVPFFALTGKATFGLGVLFFTTVEALVIVMLTQTLFPKTPPAGSTPVQPQGLPSMVYEPSMPPGAMDFFQGAPMPPVPGAGMPVMPPFVPAPADEEDLPPESEMDMEDREAPEERMRDEPESAAAPPAPRAAPPAPRVEAPTPRAAPPAPRAEAPAPRAEAPAPRVEAPAPRAEAPAPHVEAPAPRAEAPAPHVEAAVSAPLAAAVESEDFASTISTTDSASSVFHIRDLEREHIAPPPPAQIAAKAEREPARAEAPNPVAAPEPPVRAPVTSERPAQEPDFDLKSLESGLETLNEKLRDLDSGVETLDSQMNRVGSKLDYLDAELNTLRPAKPRDDVGELEDVEPLIEADESEEGSGEALEDLAERELEESDVLDSLERPRKKAAAKSEEHDLERIIGQAEAEAALKTEQALQKESERREALPVLKKKSWARYEVPVEGVLKEYPDGQYWIIDEVTKKSAVILRETLNEFNIQAEVTGIRKGPVITMFEILPAPGVKLSKIVNLQDNIALRLAASSVRIVAPIPGKHAVGIEIPNARRNIVSFRELIETELTNTGKKGEIPVVLGKDITGEAVTADLAAMPHLLIAGSTGSGKSVCVNTMILSILYQCPPSLCRLILIDPKIVELKLYNDIPHLLTPVITEPKRAFQALQYCIYEMERRYACLDSMGVRDIKTYNKRIKDRKMATEHMPYIVVVIDEFADLMATTGKELESTVARLAAMSRAVGIHLVLATQRPSIDVITGLIKSNIPSRIAFMVASMMDSRIIIDGPGAEKLLGKGDMLYAGIVDPFPVRMQGAFVSEEEVEKVVEYVKTLGEPDYIDEEIFYDDEDEDGASQVYEEGDDPLYDKAFEIVQQQGKASASYIQRRLKIGYNRAARLVEEMEHRGVVGPAQGSRPRELLRGV